MKRAPTLAALSFASLFAMPAFATTTALTTDGTWFAFDVDELTSVSTGLEWIDLTGSPLTFTFSLTNQGILKIVDAGFAGDTFSIDGIGSLLTATSAVPQSPAEPGTGLDFDAAFANHTRFSFAEVLLDAGSYSISGALLQSAVDGSNVPFNATVGGISVTAVPLPASGLLLLGASGVLGAIRRRITA